MNMRKITILVAFIIWIVVTAVLCITVVGAVLLFVATDTYQGENRWMIIGQTLVDKLIENDCEI